MDHGVILPFMTDTAYAEAAGLEREVIFPAERGEVRATTVWPRAATSSFDYRARTQVFPAVTVTALDDVVVRGKSNMLTTPDAVLRHELMDLEGELPPERFYGRLATGDGHAVARWAPYDPFQADYLPEASAFLDGTAFNYAHWITEVLPRIAAFFRSGRAAKAPLLVDSDLHPNIMRSIRLLAPEAAIRTVRPEEVLRIGVLHHVSATGYAPFKLYPQPVDRFSHGLFGAQALQGLVERLRETATDGRPRSGRRKLFIRRNSNIRRLVNEVEIEAGLTARGFITIEPEAMSLEDQIAAYSDAEMIVGATGAALVNIAFCRRDCPTVVLMPKFREAAYRYWHNVAVAAGAGPVVYACGPQTQVDADPFGPLALHRDFRVELKDVLDAVDGAMTLRP